MKKSLFIGLVAILGLIGCSRNQEIDVPDANLSLFARTESPAESRTVVESGTHVFWEPGDEIAVFMGEKAAKFTTDITAASGTATFKGTFGDQGWPEELDLWAVYPYSEEAVFDGETLTTTLPSEQIAREGSFGKDMNLSIAHSNSSTLQFYNVGGGLRFSVQEEGIKKVMFEGLSGEIISGKVKIGMDENGKPEVKEVTGGSQFITLLPPSGKETFETGVWYYIIAIPGSLEGGYKLRFYKDTDYARKVSENAVEIKRSIYGSLEKADEGLAYMVNVPDNEIWYTSIDGEVISPYYLEDVLSNEYSDGYGKIKFNHQVTEIPSRAFYETNKLETISLPESVKRILGAAFFSCERLKSIDMPGVTFIDSEAFSYSGLEGTLFLPEGLIELGTMAFSGCPYLTEVIIPKSLKTFGLDVFSDCPLKKMVLKPIEPPMPPEYLNNMENPVELYCYNSGLRVVESCWKNNGLIYVPEESLRAYQSSDVWQWMVQFITVEGKLPSDCYYASEDYSHDGELVLVQKATVGHGVNLIVLGDGFVDRDIVPGGKYEQRLRIEIENLFTYEPYKTLRNRFNVYQVNVVSKNDVYLSPYAVRTLTKDTDYNRMDCFEDVSIQYARKVSVSEDDPLFVAVLRNKRSTGERDFCVRRWLPNYISISYCSDRRPDDEGTFPHEVGGHGIGLLADEYIGVGATATENDKGAMDNMYQVEGWGPNVDWRNDPSEVRWSRFLSDSRYSEEGLGVFEGGMVYEFGVFRCSENSIMNQLGSHYYSPAGLTSYWFNAPSRESIYKQIMRISEGNDWKYDYEEFVKTDAAGREQAAKAYQEWKTKNDEYWNSQNMVSEK